MGEIYGQRMGVVAGDALNSVSPADSGSSLAFADLATFAWPGNSDAQAELRKALYLGEMISAGLGLIGSMISLFVARTEPRLSSDALRTLKPSVRIPVDAEHNLSFYTLGCSLRFRCRDVAHESTLCHEGRTR